MPVESRLPPDDIPVFAAHATALIDATLDRLGEAERAAFWASVRKCYNTPYNDPKPRPLPATTLIVQTRIAQADAPEHPIPGLDLPGLDLPGLDLPELDPQGRDREIAMPVAAMRGPGLGTEAHVS